MNCYEIKIRVFIQYEESDGMYHPMDPRCDTWTVRDVVTATALAWAESEKRARNLVDTLDFYPYDVTDYEIDAVYDLGPEPDAEEEEIEITELKTPFDS